MLLNSKWKNSREVNSTRTRAKEVIDPLQRKQGRHIEPEKAGVKLEIPGMSAHVRKIKMSQQCDEVAMKRK